MQKSRQRHAVRLILQQLFYNTDIPKIVHDRYGKPFIPGSPWSVSVSHSHQIVAIQLAKGVEAGIDVQIIRSDISHIAQKFISAKEMDACNAVDERYRNDFMHIVWGAKEVLYKIYAKRELIFKEQLFIDPFQVSLSGRLNGIIKKSGYHRSFALQYEKMGDYMLVYAV